MMKQSILGLLALGAANAMRVSEQKASPMHDNMDSDNNILAQTAEDHLAPVDMNEDAGELAQTARNVYAQAARAYAYAQTMQGPMSTDYSEPLYITFVNESDQDLDLYWYNYSGVKVPYGTIPAGGSKPMWTYATHPWDVEGVGTFRIDGDDVWVPEGRDNRRTIYIEEYVDYRSINSDNFQTLTFKNVGDVPAKILWHDFTGGLIDYGTLAPLGSYDQGTYATHPWSAQAPDGMCLNIDGLPVYVMDEQDATVYIDTYKSVTWDQPMPLIFDNQSGEEVELWWHDYDGVRQTYGTIADGASKGMNTYATHPWSATGVSSSSRFSVKNDCVYETQIEDVGRVISIRKVD